MTYAQFRDALSMVAKFGDDGAPHAEHRARAAAAPTAEERMRQSSSGFARPTREIEQDRQRRIRLANAKAERQRAAMERLDEATLSAMIAYQQEKARAARQGKPTLKTLDEWRGGSA